MVKRYRYSMLLCLLAFALSTAQTRPGFACKLPDHDSSQLKERIQFGVKWWFIPVLETYMETHLLRNGEEPNLYRLTHQAALNTFWNDRMESVVDSKSLLPCRMETIVKDKESQWKDRIIFDRDEGIARLLRQDRQNGEVIVNTVEITPTSMDPLSAFYYLRKRLSPSRPYLEAKGITDSRRFSLRGKLVAEERITVPAGSFNTYRFECTLAYWPQTNKENRSATELGPPRSNAFTLWVSQDEHRFPVQIQYRLALGSLTIRAISVHSDDTVS